ncbi:MAG: ATP-binding protein, partial [Pseudomonadota bacterium]
MQNLLQTLSATSLDAVVACDASGHIVAFNDRAENIFGWKAKDIMGRLMADLMVPDRFRDAHTKSMNTYLESGAPKIVGSRVEIFALKADGSEFPIELGLTELRQDGELVFVSFIRDLSEQRASAEALERAKQLAEEASLAKSRLSGMIAHDMRNALGGVIGSVNLIDRNSLSQENARALEALEVSCHDLSLLLDDTLDLTAEDAGALSFEFEQLPLEPFLNELSAMWRFVAGQRGLTYDVEVDARAPEVIVTDRRRLRRVLSNLLSNAFKHVQSGSVRLRARETDGELELSVEDTGPGFSDEALCHAFEFFGRPADEKTPGTGLGLSIARQLIEGLGGEIRIDLEHLEGARLVISLPIRSVEADQFDPPAAVIETSGVLRGMKVLVADDNQMNRFVAHGMLVGLGADPWVENDGLAAIET